MTDIFRQTGGGIDRRLKDMGDGSYADVVYAVDPWIQQALEEIRSPIYGLGADCELKPKGLRKFGRTLNADNGALTTIMELPGTERHETFADGNDIDYVCSSSAADAGKTIDYEGHYLDGSSRKVFFTEQVTLDASDGRTPVALPRSGNRTTRAKRADGTLAEPATDLVGTISFYRSADTTVTAGVPQTASGVNLQIVAGRQQSEKCASSFSYQDVGILTGGRFWMNRQTGGGTATVLMDVQYRNEGGVWLPMGLEFMLTPNMPSERLDFDGPYPWVRNGADFRAVALSDTDNVTVGARLDWQLVALS